MRRIYQLSFFQHEPEFDFDYPRCVVGCVSFPDVDGFRPVSRTPLLPGKSVEYTCDSLDLVPHTDKNLTMVCLTNGTLVPDPEEVVPVCVEVNTCRVNTFPVHDKYVVNDSSIVFYRHGETIQMKCADEDLVAEIRVGDANGTTGGEEDTFGIQCGGDENSPSFQVRAGEQVYVYFKSQIL